jgi:hypothetical protein
MVEQAKRAGRALVTEQVCPIHGKTKFFQRTCIICHNQSEQMVEQARRVGREAGKFNLIKFNQKEFKWCDKCDMETYHNGLGICLREFPEYINSNFITKDRILYYKGTEIHKLIKQLDNNEIDVPPGFEKRLGSWTYNRMDILTNDKILLNNSNFVENKNVMFVMDHRCNDYIEWDKFKIDYEDNATLIEQSDIFRSIKEFYQNATVMPTYITNIDKGNPNARYMEGLGIFQHRLVELGIGYCAYAKFGTDGNNLIPLVSGKSGSLLVNNYGHDLSFSTERNDGPARCYIMDHNLKWYQKAIIVIPAKDERDALDIESDLHNFGFPFGS